MGTSDTNFSTEHQKPGDAARPTDTLDRERGKRASFDRATGEAHGSGSGAGGGGNRAEDYDEDSASGGGAEPQGAPRPFSEAERPREDYEQGTSG